MNVIELLRDLPETNRGGKFKADPGPYKLNDTAQLSCVPSAGFKPLSNYVSTVVLKADGTLTWDPPKINCEPISELTELPKTQKLNTFFSNVTSPYLLHDRATLNCNLQYNYTYPPIKDSTVILHNGKLVWDPSEINCIPATCPEPKLIWNGHPNRRDFTFGQSFSYECDPGYKLNKRINEFFCNYNKSWLPVIPNDIACEPVKCPPLNPPAHGTLSFTGLTFNSDATYKCDSNYVMIKGDERRHCQSDGTWSGEEVTCAQLSCPPLDPSVKVLTLPPKDGERTNLVVIDCGSSNVTMRCMPTGWWLYEHPYCNKILEKNRNKINPDSLKLYNSLFSVPSQSSVIAPVPNVPTPVSNVPAPVPNVPAPVPNVPAPVSNVLVTFFTSKPKASVNASIPRAINNRPSDWNAWYFNFCSLLLLLIILMMGWLMLTK